MRVNWAHLSNNELLIRVLSALVLIPIVLVSIFKGGYYFTSLLIITALLMFKEWTNMVSSSSSKHFIKWHLVGIFYIGIPIAAFYFIRELRDGEWWLFWIFLMVWSMDIGGYFVGKSVGGPKLFQKISPKKTWSGLIGGIGFAIFVNLYIFHIVSFILNLEMPIPHPFWWAAAIVALCSQMGDLLESAFKRYFGVKDTGTLIPGHGGVLDRLDGLLIVAPLMAIWFIYAGQY
ncbi:MAG: phosphatidate cytidylyltransferase [Sphingomonadales bacterium]